MRGVLMSSRHRFEIQFVFFCSVRSKLIGLFRVAWKCMFLITMWLCVWVSLCSSFNFFLR